MKTAIIVMSILGCDDSATQCHYIEQVNQQWSTVQACDAASENALANYRDRNYPMVVAVCQSPTATDVDMAGIGEDGAGGPLAMPEDQDIDIASERTPVPPGEIGEHLRVEADETDPGFISKALSEVRAMLPEKETVKSIVAKPVHIVTDSYSWVAKKF